MCVCVSVRACLCACMCLCMLCACVCVFLCVHECVTARVCARVCLFASFVSGLTTPNAEEWQCEPCAGVPAAHNAAEGTVTATTGHRKPTGPMVFLTR